MAGEVIVGAVGDALKLRPLARAVGSEREVVLDVHRALGVVRELLGGVLVAAQVFGVDAQARVPVPALVDPGLVPVLVGAGLDEELHLHLLELPCAEDEVARRDLVSKRLALLRYSERYLYPAGIEDVLEVGEDALRRLRSQKRKIFLALDGACVGLEHQVERPDLGEVAAAVGGVLYALVGGDNFGHLFGRESFCVYLGGVFYEVVGAVAFAGGAALDEHVVEGGGVAGGVPHSGVLDDGRIHTYHVVAHVDYSAPPFVLDVFLQLDSERAVVIGGADAAVDLGGLVDESPALAKRDDLVHIYLLRHSDSF